MKNFMSHKIFLTGFSGALFVFFVIAGWISFYKFNPTCPNCWHEFGFPFTFYLKTDGIITVGKVVWSGVIANTVLAVIFSFIIGFIVEKVWLNILVKKLK